MCSLVYNSPSCHSSTESGTCVHLLDSFLVFRSSQQWFIWGEEPTGYDKYIGGLRYRGKTWLQVKITVVSVLEHFICLSLSFQHSISSPAAQNHGTKAESTGEVSLWRTLAISPCLPTRLIKSVLCPAYCTQILPLRANVLITLKDSQPLLLPPCSFWVVSLKVLESLRKLHKVSLTNSWTTFEPSWSLPAT